MWTALVLAAIVIVGVGAYGAWAVHSVSAGAPWWPFIAGLPFAYLAVPFIFTCLWVALGWWLRGERPGDATLTTRQRLVLFAGEFAALARSAPRMIFYRVLVPDPPPAPAALPVLLVHGVGCNGGVWSGFRGYLLREGLGPVYALSYGPPLASIEHFARQLATKIDEIRVATGAAQVVIIAHSMGGLVARAYLRRFGGAHVRRLVTVGSPHAGSLHAWMMFGRSLAEMRPRNPWLTDLNDDTGRAAGVPVVSLWSWHDSMVTPQTSSRLEWAENIIVTGIAHNALLNDAGVWARLAAEIRRAAASADPAATRAAAPPASATSGFPA